MPSFCAISSAESPEPRRNALSRLPISSKRIGIGSGRALFRLQTFRRIECGNDDVLVAGAAAQIAGNADADVLLGRVRIVAQQLDQRGQDARRAEAALQAMIVAKRLLQRMQL